MKRPDLTGVAVALDVMGIVDPLRADLLHIFENEAKRQQQRPSRRIDRMIGRLDRLLSEFLIEAKRSDLDEADRQTLKHHADDLLGVGNVAIEALLDSRLKGRVVP